MAKIKFGMMMTDASGKLGGQVFSKNRGGSYVRTKVTPSNARTSAQMAVRGPFASVSSAWSGLSEDQRKSFNGFVSSYGKTDIFGDIRNPSGKALFQRLNQNLILSNQPNIAVCVSPQEVPFADLVDITVSNAENSMNITTAGDTTGCKLLVFATNPLSHGTSFVKNKLRLIGVFSGGDSVAFDVADAYNEKFGAFANAMNIHVGVRVINSNGQASPLEVKKTV